MNYDLIKKETIDINNIIKINGFFRFVNHDKKLLTTGFANKEDLIRNSDIIRFDDQTLLIMNVRYIKNKDKE